MATTTTTTTLVGADDPDRAPIPELRDVFAPADRIVCREAASGAWLPLFDERWDHVVFTYVPVEWASEEDR